jgi:fatty acid desaturase
VSTPWDQAAKAFRAELARSVPTEALRALHALHPWRHALIALRQVALLALAVAAILLAGERAVVWIPASVVIGFVVFDFSVLLHEVVHEVVTRERDSRWQRVLGHVYGVLGGLSASQFRRWHLDHHDNLGTEDRDPKRHSLTPKIVTRAYKALYLTPALFPIYLRAARREAAGYPSELKRRIRRERAAVAAFHVGVPVALGLTLGWPSALALHLVPVFLVFPVAFTLNRLGQHYDVDPDDPARWGTLMRRSPWLWDRVFLWSNHHLEHHYFPRVPCYHLPRLRRLLEPFFEARGIRPRGYAGLAWDWWVRNRTPHTDWRRGRTRAPGVPAPPAPREG